MNLRAVLLVALVAPAALAQSPDPPTVVVSGTRLADDGSLTVLGREVIDRASIEARRPLSLVEILRDVAGVHVIEQGGRGGFASVLLRGGEPNFTAVFIDGVQVNDPTNSRGGSFDFSTLGAEDIERIEVIRGSQSAVYGSDALAGVINIVTRRDAERVAGGVGVLAGSDGLRSATAHVALPLGEHSLRVALFDEDDGDPVPGSSYEATGGRLAANLVLGDSTSLAARFSGLTADASAFPEDSGGPRLAVLRDAERREIDENRYHLALRQGLSAAVVTLSASRYERDEFSDAPGIAPGVIDGVPPIVSDTTFERDVLSLVARTDGDSLSAALGAELRREDGRGTGGIDFGGFIVPTDYGIDRTVTSVFAEARYAPGEDWLINAGLRHDDADGFDAELTTRLAVRYRLSQNLSAYVNWGEAFKLPSFYALALPIIANPDLLPEESESLSAGIEWTSDGGRHALRGEAFRTRYRNLVDFEPTLFTNVNRGRVIASGVDASWRWHSGDGSFAAESQVSYLDTDIRSSDGQLRGRPRLRGSLGGSWQASRGVSVRGDVRYTDSVFESSVPTGLIELPSYVRADVTVNWQGANGWTAYAGAQNLFDRDYEQAVGFPAPGRRVFLGLRYEL